MPSEYTPSIEYPCLLLCAHCQVCHRETNAHSTMRHAGPWWRAVRARDVARLARILVERTKYLCREKQTVRERSCDLRLTRQNNFTTRFINFHSAPVL